MKTYSELAKHLAIQKGLKVETHYGNKYSQYAVYIPRVYSGDYRKAKIRVLREGDGVKNCLKITFNPDLWTKEQVEGIINSMKAVIKNNLHGTCQTHLTVRDLRQIVTGVLGLNGQPTNEAKQLLHN